jgi:hypothetical protein
MNKNCKLIHGEYCCYGNSSYGYSEGYDWYYCSCGKWKRAFNKLTDAQLSHYNHVLDKLRK